MSEQLEFYRTRAAAAKAEAEAATLINVRDRALLAEASWNEMARRVLDTQRRRAARIAAD